MEKKKLTANEIEAALADLDGWSVVDGKLHRDYQFKNFVEAMGWMVSAALKAEKMGHHPEWFNVWNRVVVDLQTHDIGNAISSLDVALAHEFESLRG